MVLSNPIFSSTGRVNSKVPYSGCKAEEEGEWAQPHQQPAFSTRKELKMKQESVFTIYGVEWLSLISSSLSPPPFFAFFFLSRRQENPFLFLYCLLRLICSSRALFLIRVWDGIRPRRRVPSAGKGFFLLIFDSLLALPLNKGFFSFSTRESPFQME